MARKPDLSKRNKEIYRARLEGETFVSIAKRHRLSAAYVSGLFQRQFRIEVLEPRRRSIFRDMADGRDLSDIARAYALANDELGAFQRAWESANEIRRAELTGGDVDAAAVRYERSTLDAAEAKYEAEAAELLRDYAATPNSIRKMLPVGFSELVTRDLAELKADIAARRKRLEE